MANLDFLTNDSDSEDDAQVQWASGKCAVQIVWPAVIIALIIPFTISAASHRFDAAEQLHTLRKQQHVVPNQTAHHLLVISHGFQGQPLTAAFVFDQLTELLAPHGVMPYMATANWGILNGLFSTSDGVDVGGERLVQEVRDVVSQLDNITTVSFLGISLGGLYVRYALTEVVHSSEPVLADLRVANLITLASPHLGVRNHMGFAATTLAHLGFAGRTGQQLFLLDDPATPLLRRMASGKFLSALRQVDRLVLVAAIEHDNRVPYRSAAIVPHDDHLYEVATEEGDSGIQDYFRREHPAHENAYIHGVFEQTKLYKPFGAVGCDAAAATAAGTNNSTSTSLVEPREQVEACIGDALRGVARWVNVDMSYGDDWAAPYVTHQRNWGIALATNRSCLVEHLVANWIQVE